MAKWDDKLKAEVITKYKDSNPTSENSIEIVATIAEDLGDEYTVNGVRMILIKDGCYIKTTAATNSEKKTTGTRVNKAEAIKNLTDLINAQELEVDDDIIGKLTGKAALYFTNIIKVNLEE